MERNPVFSSNIVSIGYETDSQVLEIEFRSGAVYQYPDVSGEDYDAFLAADSKGSWFHHNLKHRPCVRM